MSLKTFSFLNSQVFVIDRGGIARKLCEQIRSHGIVHSFIVSFPEILDS